MTRNAFAQVLSEIPGIELVSEILHNGEGCLTADVRRAKDGKRVTIRRYDPKIWVDGGWCAFAEGADESVTRPSAARAISVA